MYTLGFTPLTEEQSQGVAVEPPKWWEKIIDYGGKVITSLPPFQMPSTVPAYPTTRPPYYDPGMYYPDTSRIPPAPVEESNYILPLLGAGLVVLLLSRR